MPCKTTNCVRWIERRVMEEGLLLPSEPNEWQDGSPRYEHFRAYLECPLNKINIEHPYWMKFHRSSCLGETYIHFIFEANYSAKPRTDEVVFDTFVIPVVQFGKSETSK